jgi:hypothetical protein
VGAQIGEDGRRDGDGTATVLTLGRLETKPRFGLFERLLDPQMMSAGDEQ